MAKTPEPSKVYRIEEAKSVVYIYKVYARSKAEALAKFNGHADYEEIGLEPGIGGHKITVEEMGEATDKCAVCGESYSPENVRDYKCKVCPE